MFRETVGREDLACEIAQSVFHDVALNARVLRNRRREDRGQSQLFPQFIRGLDVLYQAMQHSMRHIRRGKPVYLMLFSIDELDDNAVPGERLNPFYPDVFKRVSQDRVPGDIVVDFFRQIIRRPGPLNFQAGNIFVDCLNGLLR